MAEAKRNVMLQMALAKAPRRFTRTKALIANVHDLCAVTQTQRHRIVTLLRNNPLTAAQIARELRLPRTRVYYHLRILLAHGFVRGGGTQGKRVRRYVATATNFIVDRQGMRTKYGEECLNKAQARLLGSAAFDFSRLSSAPPDAGALVMAARTFFRVRSSTLAAVRRRLSELFYDLDALPAESGGDEVELVIACFPIGLAP